MSINTLPSSPTPYVTEAAESAEECLSALVQPEQISTRPVRTLRRRQPREHSHCAHLPTVLPPLGSPFTTPTKTSYHTADSESDADIDDVSTTPITRLPWSKRRRITKDEPILGEGILRPTMEDLRHSEANDIFTIGILTQLLDNVATGRGRDEMNSVFSRLLPAGRVEALLK